MIMRTSVLVIVLLGTVLILGGCSKEEGKEPTAEKKTVEAEKRSAAPVQVSAGSEGQAVYAKACASCHGTGIAGAPKFGDQAAWKSRIAQGMDVLVAHSIKGYQGQTGFMPAKGGNASLTDGEVASAVAYIVENSK